MVKLARELAGKAHEGEVRKIRQQPFISHPIGVARIASEYDPSDFTQSLSLLHDIVDQPLARERLPLPEIREQFGYEMVLAIGSLSKSLKAKTEEDAKLDYLLVSKMETDPQIQLVRAADKIHNLEQAIEELHLVQHGFWRHFKGGKEAYLRWPADVLGAIRASRAIDGHEILLRYETTIERFYAAADDQPSDQAS